MLTRLRVVGLALVLASAPLRVQGQGAGAPSEQRPEIATSADGEVRVTPDRATILIGVQTRAATAAAAASENARRQRAVIDTLEGLGIPENLISTFGYNVYPETRFDTARQRQEVTAYVVSNVVRAEIHQIAKVGPAIDAALNRGANQINSLQFSASNADEARHTALAQAVAKARADAEVMAKAAGGQLGGVLSISQAGGYPQPVYQPMMMEARAAGVAPTPISPGELTVHVSVSARWAFVDGKR